MELLGYEILNETTFGPQIDEEKFYCPQMTRLEMLRMEDITSPYRNLHRASYDHITSKVLRPSTARMPELEKTPTEGMIKKKVLKLEVNDRIDEVAEEVQPFYKVVSDYLRNRPVTAVNKNRMIVKSSDCKRSPANSPPLGSLSTLASPKGIPLSLNKKL